MLDPKDGGPIYQGIVALEAASVAASIEHYLTTSEQIDSRLVLATDGDAHSGDAAAADAERGTRRRRHVAPRGVGRRARRGGAPRRSRRRSVAGGAVSDRRYPDDDGAARALPLRLLERARIQCVAHARPRRDREHSRRAGNGRRDLRILQSELPVGRRRRARAVRARRRRRRTRWRAPVTRRASNSHLVRSLADERLRSRALRRSRSRDDRAARPRLSVRHARHARPAGAAASRICRSCSSRIASRTVRCSVISRARIRTREASRTSNRWRSSTGRTRT